MPRGLVGRASAVVTAGSAANSKIGRFRHGLLAMLNEDTVAVEEFSEWYSLFVGLVFWLWLMWRGLAPALRERSESQSGADALPDLRGGHSVVLRFGPDVRRTKPPRHRRVLALVSSPSVGGGLLRGVRNGGDRVSNAR